MAPKRKSDAIEFPSVDVLPNSDGSIKENSKPVDGVAPIFKKARVSEPEASGSTSKGKKKAAAAAATPKVTRWQDVELEGEDDGSVPIFDDCNDIRRKIRALQKTPGWKVTAWLREIGNINNNSYGRFMKESGPSGGAANGTYYAAYVYFEKVRIMEGKKKTAKRTRTEQEHYSGLPREDRSKGWVFVGK